MYISHKGSDGRYISDLPTAKGQNLRNLIFILRVSFRPISVPSGSGLDEFRHTSSLFLTAKIIIVRVRCVRLGLLALSPFAVGRTLTQDGVPYVDGSYQIC